MFENVQEAIAYIESKRNKRTVDEFRTTLRNLGINMKQPHMIHIAGTNGKGSTVNYLRAILNANGYSVGTFTSPYMVRHNDRIRIDNVPISDEDLLMYINKFYHTIEVDDMSMFEIDTMIMLAYFEDHDLDYRIIECGIGGKHDKTNVIDPEISAITNIGMDHAEQIGPTLYDIINEKMGIIKPHQLFITSEISGTILARLQEECDARDATMIVVPEYENTGFPFWFVYRDMAFTLKDQGYYQVTNARLALTIASKLITLDKEATIKAVEGAKWPGRFETLSYFGHKVVIDGAHNVPAIEELLKTLSYYKDERIGIIFSSIKEDQAKDCIALLTAAHYPVILTHFEDERAIDMEALVTRGTTYMPAFEDAIKQAVLQYEAVVVTGSLHFISQVRKMITEEK
ncbi:bifunctional folylpolyglutamate synthase/dihydrofolate synthase [Intestinibaculum porci]|jgi:dihydrofolate synthase/folylpolyglutamate synthase|uniref:tetrahydrofolate synthase n=1 Tax=Intestinibaculum porci TaxID=2487118 RepID=A0A3G9J4S7_9FIRM|nr:Mur ligase family protein [Intestinibaculum porci]MDD6349414.1 Mur ligase family protein [Intestinibaculum porci]MDD6422853.1 Mur ligase family protein [Intestinibaculum porci]BBH25756.1 bifunctional folylpolyglutamate synthase/dihydrofolate synthase [Intestinibaculum porci]